MYKILVIDDEQEIVKILEEFLTKAGFSVITAAGGEEGIKVLNSAQKLDLMIMDMRMPKVNGVDVLKEMKRINKNIPIIILTGSIDASRHEKDLKELGYSRDDIVSKPIDLFSLLAMAKKKLPQQ
jgi:DNA-binding response OmpR family regulator